MKSKFTTLFILSFLFSQIISSQQVSWISSTNNSKWIKQAPLKMISIGQSKSFETEVYTHEKQQVIDGWGGCFNELGWDALKTLNEKERNMVLNALFNQKVGLKFNICRMPIGANDYSHKWHSLNDSVGDFVMKHFSIENDQKTLIPYIKAAMKIRPDLQIWASPWSPPAWMKTNNHYANKPGDHNDLTEENAVKSGDQFVQKKEYLTAYALYLAKFSQEYKKQGISISAIHFQNEPYTYNQWPNCSWTAKGMTNFVANYLGPTFSSEKISSQIWFGTINNANPAVFDSILSNPASKKFISGVGFQYEGKDVVEHIYKIYPDLKRMQTEGPCGNGHFSWSDAEKTFKTIQFYIEKGVNSYMYWNMVLDNVGESTWGWKQNALITIDKNSYKVTYTPEYYLFKHFSGYVVPGSYRLKSEGVFKNIVSFITPQGKVIIVALNSEKSPKLIKVRIANKYFEVSLPAQSFNTFSI